MLYNKLSKYAQSDMYPMHMPGHKRNPVYMPDGLPFDLDITEIRGFDDLHNMQGVLLETSKLAAKLYNSREAFLLTTGSTTGILAAIGAHTGRGDKVLADANCHRSVINAAGLFGLELVLTAPETDEQSGVPCSVTPIDIDALLSRNPGTRLVVITSPSYEGVISDIAAIAEIVHGAGALFFVDCAHGAHLGFDDNFPESPICLGADIAVTSLHKTLPALTQCSLLHACTGRADTGAIKKMLYTLQTSSPSYVLMASIDHCLRLLEADADMLFRDYVSNLEYFKNLTKNLKNLSILDKKPCFFGLDPGKIVIVTKSAAIDGFELADILRVKHSIELERACPDYAIAMTSICDTREGFTRLAGALTQIDITLVNAD